MKKIKIVIFLSIAHCHYAAAMLFPKHWKDIPENIKEFGKDLREAAPELGKGSADVLVDGGKEIADKVVEAGSTIGDGLAMVGAMIFYVHVASKVVEIGKDVVNYLDPSEEQQNKELQAQEKKEALKSKRQLRSCLMKNHTGARNESGRPVACEDAARMLVMMKGENALEKMTKRFTTAYGK